MQPPAYPPYSARIASIWPMAWRFLSPMPMEISFSICSAEANVVSTRIRGRDGRKLPPAAFDSGGKLRGDGKVQRLRVLCGTNSVSLSSVQPFASTLRRCRVAALRAVEGFDTPNHRNCPTSGDLWRGRRILDHSGVPGLLAGDPNFEDFALVRDRQHVACSGGARDGGCAAIPLVGQRSP